MTDDMAEALLALFERLGPYLQTDPALRAAVGTFGRAVTALAERAAPPEAAEPPVPARPAVPEPPPPPLFIPPDFSLERPAPLARPAAHDDHDDDRGIAPADLGLVARRCELKAEAARAVAAVKRGDVFTVPDALVRRAQALPDCDLWMAHPGDYADAPKVWDDLGGAFAVGAAAAELLALLKGLPEPLAERHRERALYAAAEAQALVWAGVLDTRRRVDSDQVQLFVHVREEARRHAIYINRYLRREDRVPADRWPELLGRLALLREQLAETRTKAKSREKGLRNLLYKLRKMGESPGTAAAEWPRALELLEEVVAAGVPPSNAEVRDLLLPVLDTLPDDQEPGPNAERVFAAANEYLATRPAPVPARAEEPTPDVRAVAELLRGREVVLIGGVERAASRALIERAFGLERLNWLSTRPHESITHFEPAVARPNVALVLLAIRWSSHSYGDVKDYCDKYGKPIVYLTAGYNPNQIAHHILQQVGDRLRALTRAG